MTLLFVSFRVAVTLWVVSPPPCPSRKFVAEDGETVIDCGTGVMVLHCDCAAATMAFARVTTSDGEVTWKLSVKCQIAAWIDAASRLVSESAVPMLFVCGKVLSRMYS